ncbi:hypothetical protein PGB90_010005 [Kerria lacca]
MNKLSNITLMNTDINGAEWLTKSLEDVFAIFGTSRCEKFVSMNHIFHIANILVLLSHFAPNGKFGIIYLRLMLLIGCGFFAIWGFEICSLDVVIWNVTFVICNVIYIVVLLIYLWPTRFTKEIEELYTDVFRPLKVTRKQFKKLVKCIKTIKSMKYQEIYAQEKVTRVEFLSVLLSGKLVISQQSRALHVVFPHQFLDSPEWFGVSTDDFFQVSITALEESRILLWHRDKLKFSILHDKFLKTVLDHILSRDVVNKLIQANEAVITSTNGHLPTTYNDDAFCDKSLMIVKRSGDGSGISALINKQLQGLDYELYLIINCRTALMNDFNTWRLGKIDEVDFETSV